ncbi:MAG TPA: beta-ketoacyl-[acyl-carrier-protein] synthase family protein, partial [Chitinivibrionales bacterium]|nr:beta-ketoacyl-[acyl-carrier-protein] synthase family protein [Chitinivibrionales bacterium]
ASFSPIGRPHLSHLRATHAGLVRDFDERAYLPQQLRFLDRFVHFAAAACREAIGRAHLDPRELGPRMGLVFATCSGPMQTIERRYAAVLAGDGALTREELFSLRYYSGAKALAHLFGISGPGATVVTACSASTAAIGIAADLIRLGVVDAALAGGSDTFAETTLAGFDGLKATCEGTCAPFSKPPGLNLGEGTAFLVLESMEAAQARGASVHAEILGFGLSNDAYHCTAPDPSGAGQSLAMERALADAGVSPLSIRYINAHGTGTEANDKAETRAIRRTFGAGAASVPVSSTKSIIGHCLGAAGALETVAAIACLEKGIVPPTANFTERRDGCTLDYVPDAGRRAEQSGPVLKNNFAFGGNNASIVVKVKPDFSNAPPDRGSAGPVVITGIGAVSPAGVGVDCLVAASTSESLFRDVALDGGAVVRAAMVPDFDMAAIDRRIDIRNMDRSSVFAVAATRLALSHAFGAERPGGRRDIGLFLHLSAGPSWAESEHIVPLLRGSFRINQVAAFPYVVPNSVAGNVCKALRLTGHNTTLSLGPGAGLLGLGFAAFAIENGHASAIVSLSVDELSKRILSDSHAAGAVPPGGVPYGEGACAVMLETESSAASRGAAALGTVCSFAYSTETNDCMNADGGGAMLAATIRTALNNAKITAADIGPVVCCSAGSGWEAEAVRAVMGERDAARLDPSPLIGYAEATTPLFILSRALADSSLEMGRGKNYILTVFGSPHGVNCATVIRKSKVKE